MGWGGGGLCDQQAATKRVIVCFNCVQWIVTEVGSEVRALPPNVDLAQACPLPSQ